MTIWILVLVLLASSAALGYRQGAIRVVFSFAGIVLGALLAAPLGELFKPLMARIGIQNPLWLWVLGPLAAFVTVLIAFKVAGSLVHGKTDLHYRYRADDLAFALWERLNHRLGLCLGLLNATAYFVLICFFVFNFSYWSAQIASSDAQGWMIRLINRLGHDMESTKMTKVARAVAALPGSFYKTADLAGLLCQNPQLGQRLEHYPAFISLLERGEFKDLVRDDTFINYFQGSVPIGQFLGTPSVKNITQNLSLAEAVWTDVQTNLDDLTAYLKTGKSYKYDSELIIGFWDFNTLTTAALLPIAQPKISAAELMFARMWTAKYGQTTLIVAPDHQVFMHRLPRLMGATAAGETATLHLWPIIVYGFRNGAMPETEDSTLSGQWQEAEGSYQLSFTSNGKPDSFKVQIKNDRLTLTTSDGDTLVFDRED